MGAGNNQPACNDLWRLLSPPHSNSCPVRGGGKQPTSLQRPQARPVVSHGSNFGLWETLDPAARASRPSSCFPLLPNSLVGNLGADYSTPASGTPPVSPHSDSGPVRGGGKQPTLLHRPQARPTVSHGPNFGLWETLDLSARASRPSSCFPLLPNSLVGNIGADYSTPAPGAAAPNRPWCRSGAGLGRDPPFPMARISAFGKHSTSLHMPPGRPLVSHSCRILLSGTMEPITLLLPLPRPLSPRTRTPTSFPHRLPGLPSGACPLGWGWETTNTPAPASGTPPVSPHSNSCPVRSGGKQPTLLHRPQTHPTVSHGPNFGLWETRDLSARASRLSSCFPLLPNS